LILTEVSIDVFVNKAHPNSKFTVPPRVGSRNRTFIDFSYYFVSLGRKAHLEINHASVMVLAGGGLCVSQTPSC